MNFKFWNKTIGWSAFAIALISYFLTVEQYVPLWDCGEYISTAYKLEVGHPPGAPTFNMIGAVATYFAPEQSVALIINLISAVCSAFTILFMFWSISFLGKKIATMNGAEFSDDKKIAILGSSLIGSLAYAYTDSFWFSAVEGEVYAMSSFFTALVVWAAFKWDDVADEPYADRWLIFIMYVIGISIGVHLLNLLAIPAVGLLYYFRRYQPNTKGSIIAFVIAVLVLGVIQMVIIPGMASWPASTELFFVNDLGLPFNSGSLFFYLLIIGLIVYGIRYSEKKVKHMLNLAVMSFAVILIGFSCFAMIVIRSQANTPIDENNPENLPQLLSYLLRDQYGKAPLMSGNYWNSEMAKMEDGNPVYMRGYVVKMGDKTLRGFRTEEEAKAYVKEKELAKVEIKEEYFVGDSKKSTEPTYKPEHTTIFPRMYSREERHIRMYKLWSKYEGGEYIKSAKNQYDTLQAILAQINQAKQAGKYDAQLAEAERYYKSAVERIEANGLKLPTFRENLRFFFNYQMGWMYWRYFLWNFVGRQSDEQNVDGNIIDGNWYSGVGFIDSERLGDQSNIPGVIANNKAHNKFFYLPLILGLIGMVYHLLKAPKDWLIILLLFVFTGIAIIVYLNSKPAEPRERDYAYAGSYYAFAFWIGIGVYALFDMVKSINWKQYQKAALVSVGFGAFLLLIEAATGDRHAFSYSILFMTIVAFACIAFMRFVGEKLKQGVQVAYLAIAVGLPVPIILGYQGWDDHDRSERETARSFAMNFLRSVEKNAILFTFGDNDTFPLWYIQEVEGYHTDARIVNTSLLGTDWYIDQMTRKAYESEPVPFTMPEYIYRQGGNIDQVELDDEANANIYLDLKAELAKQKDNPRKSKRYNTSWVVLDGKSFYVNVNKKNAIKYGIVPKGTTEEEIVDRIEFRIQDNIIMKNDFMILDLLAHYDWTRPIYFATGNSSREYLGLNNYFMQEGLAYKLVPLKIEGSRYSLGGMNIEKTYNMLMGLAKGDMNYEWGGMDADNANVDYYVRRTICTSYHTVFMALAGNLLEETAKLDDKITRAEFDIRVVQDSLAAHPEDAILKARESNLTANLAKYRDLKNKYNYKDMAKKVINRCFEVMPPENVPYDTYTQYFVELLYQAGDIENGNKHLKGHIDQAVEMINYLCKMDVFFADNQLISKVAENYDIIMSMSSTAPEENSDKAMETYLIQTQESVDKLMQEWMGRIQKEDREKLATIQRLMPRFFITEPMNQLDIILSKDLAEGVTLIETAGKYYQAISNVVYFVLNSSGDQNTQADMQRLMQQVNQRVTRWLQQIAAKDPSKQQVIMSSFPDLFNRGGSAGGPGGGF